MKKILNLGCGKDTFGTHFIDLYPKRKNVIKCDVDWQKLPFPDNFFDKVYSKNLLEHLNNLGFVMKEIRRVLKPNGELELITDNASYWRWILFKDHGHLYESVKAGKHDKHYMLFTPEHLRNLVRKYNFTKIEVRLIDADIKQSKNLLTFLIKTMINYILRITPLRKLSYQLISIKAIKAK